MTQPDLVSAIGPIVAALQQLGVSYYIGGSVASSAHGLPRTTLDVDLVADLKPTHVEDLVRILGGEYYLDAEVIRDATRQLTTFNVIHLATMLKVDVFVLGADDYDRTAFRRARKAAIGSAGEVAEFVVASPEDIILLKLRWYRMGDEVAQQQWSDAVGVLKVQGDALDAEYLSKWADYLRVADLMTRALEEAGQDRG
jgi:hypothetical protein